MRPTINPSPTNHQVVTNHMEYTKLFGTQGGKGKSCVRKKESKLSWTVIKPSWWTISTHLAKNIQAASQCPSTVSSNNDQRNWMIAMVCTLCLDLKADIQIMLWKNMFSRALAFFYLILFPLQMWVSYKICSCLPIFCLDAGSVKDDLVNLWYFIKPMRPLINQVLFLTPYIHINVNIY